MTTDARLPESRCRRAYQFTYVLYRRHRAQVNFALLVLLLVALAVLWLVVWFEPATINSAKHKLGASWPARNLPLLAQVTGLVRDVLSILGIFAAGLWGWYSFVRTRTFSPKVAIDIEPFAILDGQGAKLLVLRCDVLNDGKVKINPRRITLECYAAHRHDGRLRYERLDERTDVLDECTQIKEARVNLEPQSHLRFDCEVSLRGLITEVADPVVLVRLVLADNNFFMWDRSMLVQLKELLGDGK